MYCGKSGKLPLDKALRDATADYLRRRWPSNTAKHAAKAFDLSLPRAREAVAGNASLTTLEGIIKTGGWSVALPILGEVIGHHVDQHFIEMRKSHADHGRRIAALFGDGRPGSAVDGDGAAGPSGVPHDGRNASGGRVGC
jgi:hypothetical protein